MKKLDHKLYGFDREKGVFMDSAEENEKIESGFESMTKSYDNSSADIISNSSYSELRVVKRQL